MKAKFKEWFNSERIDRVEQGTSQDTCPTNGAALLYRLVILAAWAPLMLYIGICFYLGIDPISKY